LKNYIKKGKTPENSGDLAKQKEHWNTFVQYKYSELGNQMVEKIQDKCFEESISSHSRTRWLQARYTKTGEDRAGFD